MIYEGLSRTGEIEAIKAHGGGEIAEVYGGLNEANPIFYKRRIITGTPPLSFKALGKPLSDYLIEGNTIQNGAPTPDAPVDVVGCGEWDATAQQYKIPVVCGGVTSNIYLGNVHTTRRIKKLVLTGEEDIFAYNGLGYVQILDGLRQTIAPYCNILPGVTTPSGESPDSVKQLKLSSENVASLLFKKTPGFNSDGQFAKWLHDKYSAGTPVTVWYVLAEPETGIVNEPLHKIGSYTDAITMAQAGETIPTTAGSNTLSVGTTVQPSSMSITGNIKEVLV